MDEFFSIVDSMDVSKRDGFIRKNINSFSLDDKLKICSRYRDCFSEISLNMIFSNYKNKEIVPFLIDIFINSIKTGRLVEKINLISDYSVRIKYLLKYIDRLDFYDLNALDETFGVPLDEFSDIGIINSIFDGASNDFKVLFISDLNDRIKFHFAIKIIDFIDDDNLLFLLSSFSNYSMLISLFEKVIDKIDRDSYHKVIQGIKDKDCIDDFISRYDLSSINYERIAICNFNKDACIDFLEKYLDKFESENIKKVLISNFKSVKAKYSFHDHVCQGISYPGCDFLSDDYFFDVIKKFSSCLNFIDIGFIICSISDSSYREKLFFDLINFFNPNISSLFSKVDISKFSSDVFSLSEGSFASLFSIYADCDYHINDVSSLLYCVSFVNNIDKSNSSEIRRISGEILRQIFSLPRDEWDSAYNYIEDIFMKNNIPYVGKVYEIFHKLHQDKKSFLRGVRSPNLLSMKSSKAQDVLIFNDLLRCSIKSNNRSLKRYIADIKSGNLMLQSIVFNGKSLYSLNVDDREVLRRYLTHLNSLYNCTLRGRECPRTFKNDLFKDCYELLDLFINDFNISSLPDRVVSMFTHFIGIDSIDELESCIRDSIHNASCKNISRSSFSIDEGDLIKGLSGNKGKSGVFYNYLTSILQNGNLCQEFLGSSASSDATPLDADVCRASKNYPNLYDAFCDSSLASSSYGPVWIVIKNDGKLNYTDVNNVLDPDKLEVFKTGVLGDTHYGIRTGFSSSDIDFFVVDKGVNINIIKYEIVMNGFYIPIVDKCGNLIFSVDEYDALRSNMQGLSYYGMDDFVFSSELNDFGIDLRDTISSVSSKRNMFFDMLKSSGLDIVLGRSLDLSTGNLELIDTGSTGRGTNKPDDYDFDFIMRVDRGIIFDSSRMDELVGKIQRALPGISVSSDGKIRDQKVRLPDGSVVKVDITFVPKTDKLDYSTDECIKDRLSNIKRLSLDNYYKVLSNIVYAKEVLKDCYKPRHAGGGKAQGGLGGVGIENWILQNGGSFITAARDFVSKSDGLSYSEFKNVYTVFDFGCNHMAGEQGKYPHDEFVSNNMDEDGYNMMKKVLNEFILNYDNSFSKSV